MIAVEIRDVIEFDIEVARVCRDEKKRMCCDNSPPNNQMQPTGYAGG